MSEAAVALNRFGLGARPGDAAPEAPRRWLDDQIARYQARPAALAAAPTSVAVAVDILAYRAEQRDRRM